MRPGTTVCDRGPYGSTTLLTGPKKEAGMDHYPNISDHGIIGDLQTAALVTHDGTIDFFCCPRFDSPSVFCSLLDAEKAATSRSGQPLTAT